MKKYITLLLFAVSLNVGADDTWSSTADAWNATADAWITEVASSDWTDTNDTLVAVWYMDDRQMQGNLETSVGNLSDTILSTGSGTETRAIRWAGNGRGFYFPNTVGSDYAYNTNVSGVLGASVTELSIGTWVKLVSTSANNGIFMLGATDASLGNLGIFAWSSGEWYFTVGNTENINTGVATTTNRTFVSSTWDGTNQIGYINGQPITTNAKAGPLDCSDNEFYLGILSGSTLNFKGELDKPYLFNRVLTPQENLDLYNLGEAGFNLNGVGTNGLICYYPMTNDIIRINTPLEDESEAFGWGLFPRASFANTVTMETIFGTNVNGRVLKGGSFDGTDDGLITTQGAVIPTTNDVIITQWVKFKDLTLGGLVGYDPLNTNGAFGMFLYQSNIWFRLLDNGIEEQVISDSPVETNVWYNVALRYQHSGQSELWINNVRQSTFFTNSTPLALVNTFEIGGLLNGQANFYSGTIRYYFNESDTNIIADVYNYTAPPNGDIEIRRTEP